MCVRKSFIIPFVGFRQFGNGQGDAFIRMKTICVIALYTNEFCSNFAQASPKLLFPDFGFDIYMYSKLFVIFLQKF